MPDSACSSSGRRGSPAASPSSWPATTALAAVAAGRNGRVLGQLARHSADATIRLDRPHAEVTRALLAAGPYDVIVDFVWGAPAEAFFAGLADGAITSNDGSTETRYVVVGMSAGEVAELARDDVRRVRRG